MQKDIWQPGSIVLHAVLVIKCILPENTHLLPCLPRGQHCSLPDLAKGKMKKRKKMSNLLHSKLRLGVLILVDKNMTYIFSIRLSLDKRSVGQTFLRFLAFS